MSADGKKTVAFRLTAEARRLLALLAQNRGISQTAVLEILIRDEADRRNLAVESKIAA